ncbi:MAG: EF-P lysine aminoacylase EpmA [Gammaproteobacteria bacterium]
MTKPAASALDWRPCWTPRTLRLRADLLACVRRFFSERGVLEVDTPLLTVAPGTDPNLMPMRLRSLVDPNSEYYLQTSPEFPMKRLLAAGSGPIYQIAHAFRDNERGRLHQPEFSLLEWYRPGFDHNALMDEVADLLRVTLGADRHERLSVAQAFDRFLGFDPHQASLSELETVARKNGLRLTQSADEAVYLDFLMSRCVTPHLGTPHPTLLYDYPISQCAYAQIRESNPPVAERFEVFVSGIELGNGYHELTDPVAQRMRFMAENAKRRHAGLPEVPLDERLLAALECGMPECAGIALGFDRLVMIAAGVKRLEEVMAFPFDRSAGDLCNAGVN